MYIHTVIHSFDPQAKQQILIIFVISSAMGFSSQKILSKAVFFAYLSIDYVYLLGYTQPIARNSGGY